MSNRTPRQLIKYTLAGLTSNTILYLFYIALTSLNISPKPAMSLVYSLGVLLTFFLNKNWTFQSKASNHRIFRHLLAYCLGYLLNLLILFVLVDHLGYPHQIIQGIAVICIALFLFFVQKAWVFRT